MYRRHVKLTNTKSSTQQSEFTVLAAVNARVDTSICCYGRPQKDIQDWIPKVPGKKE
jgi:hypothetical protein